MYKFYFITLFQFLLFPLTGQQHNNVIYLKNGSIIHGQIIENNTENVKLILAYDTLSFSKAEIECIENDKNTSIKKNSLYRYYNLTSIGMLIGSTVNEKITPASILMEHNYSFGKYFSVGTMLGFEWLNEIVSPVALNLKLLLPVKNSHLYISTSGGYSISTENPDEYGVKEATGGRLFNAEIGCVVSTSDYTGWYFAFGYRYNELNYKMEDWWWDNAHRTMYINRFVVRTGIMIN